VNLLKGTLEMNENVTVATTMDLYNNGVVIATFQIPV
jgi:hypothetical protein